MCFVFVRYLQTIRSYLVNLTMLHLTMIENYETTSDADMAEHTEGMVRVLPTPPDNLADPDYPAELLRLDLFSVDIDKSWAQHRSKSIKPWACLKGHIAQWDGAHWRITGVVPIENGLSCMLCIERLEDEVQ